MINNKNREKYWKHLDYYQDRIGLKQINQKIGYTFMIKNIETM